MDHSILLEQIKRVEKIAHASKIQRMLFNPIKYLFAILHRKLIYPFKGSLQKTSTTFFGEDMHLLLPASTDIYLTGGKSHESEIRLAKFMIHNLAKGDCFVDVGAHYGYFTLLASKLVGDTGQVHSFEAASTTFAMLEKNSSPRENISYYHKAVAEQKGTITFHQFPNLYSEYNSIDIKQFENNDWFSKLAPQKTTVDTIDLSSFLDQKKLLPKLIKIDVEGAEYKVIKGAIAYLQEQAPIIAMEYLKSERDNEAHRQAVELLRSLGYTCSVINREGGLVGCPDIDAYLAEHRLESDNIVFSKRACNK